MKSTKDIRLAVLIDADNIPHGKVENMLQEVAKYGTPTFKRIYGDWTNPRLTGWKGVLLENAITPIQQYGYTVGKNATDSAMIIDAMDILYTNKVDGFCIVSSDSDFTRLATRLREAGMLVIGLGEKKTPNPFIVACDKFIYLEILSPSNIIVEEAGKSKTVKVVKKETLRKVDNATVNLFRATVSDLTDDSGWAFLGEVGSLILKKKPDFDPRNFGFEKLAPLIKSTGKFEIEERESDKRNSKLVYVRIKE